MGPGKSYTGVLGTIRTADGYWSQDYVGQETWSRDWGPYLRGPADDVMLHHYGTCDICRSFGDAFYVTAPATIVRVPAPCTITASQTSVTKAGGP